MPKVFDKSRRFFATFGRPLGDGRVSCQVYFVRDDGVPLKTNKRSVFRDHLTAKAWAQETIDKMGKDAFWLKPLDVRQARLRPPLTGDTDTLTKRQNKLKMNARLDALRRSGGKRG